MRRLKSSHILPIAILVVRESYCAVSNCVVSTHVEDLVQVTIIHAILHGSHIAVIDPELTQMTTFDKRFLTDA